MIVGAHAEPDHEEEDGLPVAGECGTLVAAPSSQTAAVQIPRPVIKSEATLADDNKCTSCSRRWSRVVCIFVGISILLYTASSVNEVLADIRKIDSRIESQAIDSTSYAELQKSYLELQKSNKQIHESQNAEILSKVIETMANTQSKPQSQSSAANMQAEKQLLGKLNEVLTLAQDTQKRLSSLKTDVVKSTQNTQTQLASLKADVTANQHGLSLLQDRTAEEVTSLAQLKTIFGNRSANLPVLPVIDVLPQNQASQVQLATDALPMVDLFGADKVKDAIISREQWIRTVIGSLDNRENSQSPTFSRYDYFGPVFPLCPAGKLDTFGRGDEEKKVCDLHKLTEVHGPCEIISIGSNGQWNFEEEIFRRTDCRVHTFDCTGYFQPPLAIRSRVTSYHKCIGSLRKGNPDYLTYDGLLKTAGIKGAPTYLKIDVEGFEWNTFPEIMNSIGELPEQIGFELHYHRLMGGLGWRQSYKTPPEIAIFGEMMFRAGYVPIHRRNNKYGVPGEACEFLMARIARRADRA